LARARIGELFTRKIAHRVRLEFALDEQASIDSNEESPKLQHHATVEIKLENTVMRITHGVRNEIASL
jgi:hypothetical protein